MGEKHQNLYKLTWQSANPAPFTPNTASTGPSSGIMSSSGAIFSNIMDIRTQDNVGLEVSWSGAPTGTISVQCSNSGIKFYPLTFSPALQQPSASTGGYLISLNQLPFRYVFLEYDGSSSLASTGVLTTYFTAKDLN